ncbi:hypothetical protein D3867_26130 (plasmid) [Azospirillum argentinense]|uniref:HTH luxR-type domain-containing protein n=2 Tax=Azospirillum TaxID=191 RepID=A0A4D8Q4B0_AZOBR|nr:hypothetical protein D3867_26130 [Azospirillum argentinense]
MMMPPIPWDIPGPFADMAVMASRLRASLVIIDPNDNVVYASQDKKRLYPFIDFSAPLTFEAMLRSSWKHGADNGIISPPDFEAQLADAQNARRSPRLEFTRRFPTELICAHIRLDNGWNAQLRVEPDRAGLRQYFSRDIPTFGLLEAIRQRETAEQCAAALDCLAFGIAVLGPDRRIKHKNTAMADLISRSDGLLVDEHGRLSALHDDDTAELSRLVALASLGRLLAPTAATSIRAAAGRSHIVSVSRGGDSLGSAVVLVAPASLDVAAVSDVLHRDFKLTPAEAELAAMIGNGFTNDDAAKELGKAPGTGREQVKSILKKLDVGALANRGQTGLARWVAVLGAITGAARFRGKS